LGEKLGAIKNAIDVAAPEAPCSDQVKYLLMKDKTLMK
jgi:hypothetical protein